MMPAAAEFGFVFRVQARGHHGLFLGREPFRIFRAIIQIDEHDKSENDRGNAFEQKQPLPTGPAIHTVHVLHDGAGSRAADDAGDSDGGHE